MVDWRTLTILWRDIFVSIIPCKLLTNCSFNPLFNCRYVAMHAMQDDHSQSGHDESHGNGYLDGSHRRDSRPKSGKSLQLVLAAVAGMLLPLLTQIGHAH